MYLNLTKWSSYFRNYQNYKGHNGIIMLHQAEIRKFLIINENGIKHSIKQSLYMSQNFTCYCETY
jgi:sarcosine oxidase delta subunit